MFIDVSRNNGKPYLRLVKSVRVKNPDGFSVSKKVIIHNIGALEKFDDGQPYYVERLRQSFKDGNPLIDSLLPYVNVENVRNEVKISYLEGDPLCVAETKKFAHSLIEAILDELGVVAAVRSYKSFSKLKYDVMGLLRLLIYGRILDPQSKIATFAQNDDYYDSITDANYRYNIYDTLDFVLKHKKQLLNRINSRLIKNGNRRNEVIFYDVTNFFFETNEVDEDHEDANGKIVKGIRKYGVCKEERKLPIVQMGLFMDESGLPISIEIFPGNTLDHLTVQPALSKSIDDVINSRYIFIADRGMCNYKNISHLLKHNKGFIISKSIKKSTNEEKAWITEKSGYNRISENFKYKSRIVHKKISDENGDNIEIVIKQVAYWSKKYYDKELAENKSFFEFLEKYIEDPNNFRFSKTQAKQLKPFLKKECINKKTGELIESNDLRAMMDTEAIEQYKKSFGYYQLVTSELTMADTDIIEKYHNLTQIESQFQIMKSNLETRPMYVRTDEHIESHLTICLIALLVMRIIQQKVVEYKKANGLNNPEADWEQGLTGERIQRALNKWCVINMDNTHYQMCNVHDRDLDMILKAFNINIPNKIFTKGELKHIKQLIKIF